MSTITRPDHRYQPARVAGTHPPRTTVIRRFVGGFYLVMAGINAGIVAADPQTYRTFADGSFWPFVANTWRDVVMDHPAAWLLALALGEMLLGTVLLRGGRAARAGWVGVLVFHVLLMSFGFWVWLWSLPVLALLLPVVRRDWPLLGAGPSSGVAVPVVRRAVPSTPVAEASTGIHARWNDVVLAVAVLGASLYGLLAESPYRSLPDATVLAAKAQDACSIVVAVLLVALVLRPALGTGGRLVRLGLLGYLLYSYLIYITGVPMNRMFLAYVVIVTLSGAGLAAGLVDLVTRTPTSTASSRLRHGTGWMLVVTALLFAGLWLSTLLPVALGTGEADPQGVGGTPYPVFWLDLAVVLPAIAGVGVLLVRDRPLGPPLAAVALVKIVTLFTALWAGPVVALATSEAVHLGPDAGPSLLLLAASTWMVSRWVRALEAHASTPVARLHPGGAG